MAGPVEKDQLTAGVPSTGTAGRLYTVAAGLFRARGYAATSMRDIAAELGIKNPSLYHHIRGKEDLLFGLSVESVRRVDRAVGDALAGSGEGEARVRCLVRAHLGAVLADQDMHASMLVELRSLSGQRRAHVVELRRAYEQVVVAVMADAQAGGVVGDALTPRLLSLALLNLLNWSIFWYRPRGELHADQLAHLFCDVFLDGVLSTATRTTSLQPSVGFPPAASRPASRILDVAAAEFRARGYAATTTRELAGLLGVGSATLYHHVDRKEDLLYELCVDALARLHDAVAAAVRQAADPVARVAALLRAHLCTALADGDKHATMLFELRSLSETRRADVLQRRDSYEQLIRRTLEDAQATNVVDTTIAARYLARGMLNLLNGSIFWFNPRGQLSAAQLADALANLFLFGARSRALAPTRS